MTPFNVEAIDHTVQQTNEWLREIATELGTENRRHAYLALRGSLHAIRDVLTVDESAHLSAQLPMLVRGIYFEGWDPSHGAVHDRSRESFLGHVDDALWRAMWNESEPIGAEAALRATLRVLDRHISEGELEQIRRMMPRHVRELWPGATART
jgi:uncharacterized protein (DUF2267 family)